MISVLICGYNETYERNVKLNIAQTIGCAHEILYYRNSDKKGICEVYNLLAKQASGEIFCFVHEDVEFLTQNWGSNIAEGLAAYGLIGIAGSKYKTRTPSSMGVNNYYCWNVLQGHKYSTTTKDIVTAFHENHIDQNIEDVVCIDGVFMCIKSASMQHLRFDETNFPGFHGYDYDFSIAATTQHLRLGVIKNIKIVHFSEGETDTRWMQAQIQLYEKWKQVLPLHTNDLQFEKPIFLEFLSFKQFFFKMRDNKRFYFKVLFKLFHPIYVYYWVSYFILKRAKTLRKNTF